jgi:signal peptidase I
LVAAIQKGDNFGPVRVPPEKIFVLGDNRDRSLDSRFWGFVPVEDVRGRAFIIYWSWDGQGDADWYRLDQKIRWNRFGHFIE